MKHIIMVVAVFATTSLFAHLSAQQIVLAPILTDYYSIKDALVKSDARLAAEKATRFVKDIDNINMSAIPAIDHMPFMALKDKLNLDARHLSESTDLNHQRQDFASLSANMVSL